MSQPPTTKQACTWGWLDSSNCTTTPITGTDPCSAIQLAHSCPAYGEEACSPALFRITPPECCQKSTSWKLIQKKKYKTPLKERATRTEYMWLLHEKLLRLSLRRPDFIDKWPHVQPTKDIPLNHPSWLHDAFLILPAWYGSQSFTPPKFRSTNYRAVSIRLPKNCE